MPVVINRDTRLCMSLAGRPGNFGTRFHNFLYDALGLNYIYKAFTTTDLNAAIGGVRALSIRGCAISMPFKEACIPLLNELEGSAAAIDSVNTIVNDDGFLRGYNTDYIAIEKLIAKHQVSPSLPLALRGSGGMAKAVACALRDAGFKSGHIIARNEAAGRKLAETAGFTWSPDMNGVDAKLLINVTPIGMEGGPESEQSAFSETEVAQADVIFDVVALPAETPLIKLARSKEKKVITGAEVIAIQAVEQFVLYTGVRPDDELIERAATHARAPA